MISSLSFNKWENWGLDTFSDNLSNFFLPRVSLLKPKVTIIHAGSYRHVFSGTQDRYKDSRTISLSLAFYHDFFFFLSLHVLYQPKSQEIEEWVRYVNWLGWTGVGKREARQRQKKPLCQPLLGTLRDCMAEDQAHYMGTFFSYGKMYENLKGQAVC